MKYYYIVRQWFLKFMFTELTDFYVSEISRIEHKWSIDFKTKPHIFLNWVKDKSSYEVIECEGVYIINVYLASSLANDDSNKSFIAEIYNQLEDFVFHSELSYNAALVGWYE